MQTLSGIKTKTQAQAQMIVLIELLLFTLCTASLGHFVQLCLQPGMVFSRYGLWLEYTYRKNWRRKDKWKQWLIHPIGYCIYCTSEWIFIMLFLCFFLPLPIKDGIVLFLLGSGTNYIWIEIISKWK